MLVFRGVSPEEYISNADLSITTLASVSLFLRIFLRRSMEIFFGKTKDLGQLQKWETWKTINTLPETNIFAPENGGVQ